MTIDWNDNERLNVLEFARAREQKANGHDKAHAEPKPKLIMSSREFVAGYVAAQYLIEGIIQQRRIYSLTGKTGDGKTALQLLIAYHLATRTALGKREAEKCRVLYLAGENPDDVRMRWLAMADAMDFDVDTIDVHFLPGVYKLSQIGPTISAEVDQIGPIDFLIVDTSAAYFEGDDENSNAQMGFMPAA